MKNYSKKIAYLRGLADGLDIKNDTKESKLLKALVEAMEEIADGVDCAADIQRRTAERLNEVEERLGDLEDDFDDLADDFCELRDDMEDAFWDDEDEEDEEYAFQCPKCGKAIYLDSDILDSDDDTIVCPNCKEKIKLEFDADCGVDCDYDDYDEDTDEDDEDNK